MWYSKSIRTAFWNEKDCKYLWRNLLSNFSSIIYLNKFDPLLPTGPFTINKYFCMILHIPTGCNSSHLNWFYFYCQNAISLKIPIQRTITKKIYPTSPQIQSILQNDLCLDQLECICTWICACILKFYLILCKDSDIDCRLE